jgi:ribosomal protein S30
MASNCFKISSLSAINFSSFGSGIVSQSLTHPVRCPVQPLVPPEVKTKADRHLLAMSTRLRCLSLTKAGRVRSCTQTQALRVRFGKTTDRQENRTTATQRSEVFTAEC